MDRHQPNNISATSKTLGLRMAPPGPEQRVHPWRQLSAILLPGIYPPPSLKSLPGTQLLLAPIYDSTDSTAAESLSQRVKLYGHWEGAKMSLQRRSPYVEPEVQFPAGTHSKKRAPVVGVPLGKSCLCFTVICPSYTVTNLDPNSRLCSNFSCYFKNEYKIWTQHH